MLAVGGNGRRGSFQIRIKTCWRDSQWYSQGNTRLPFSPILHHNQAKRRRRGVCTFMCSEQLCRNKSIQIEVCFSFTPTNWDLISKMLARLFYTKKPAGRGCNRWREVGWKANLGDAYVLRVPLGLPWVGRIWQKRSVQQKNPPLCLSMGY